MSTTMLTEPAAKTPATTTPEAKLAPRAFFDEMLQDFENLWQAPWRMLANPWERFGKTAAPAMPRIDVARKDGEMFVRAELPGIKKEDVHLTLENDALVLRAERKDEKKLEEKDYFRSECSYGTFYRRIPLDFKADLSVVSAKMQDGVLEVSLPIPPQPASLAPRIEVK